LLNGEPAVFLCVYPTRQAQPKRVRARVQEALVELRRHLPPGLDLGLRFDLSAGRQTVGYLLLDLAIPAGASPKQARDMLRRCAALVASTAGIRDVLALPDNPFDLFADQPCILASLAPAVMREAGRDRVVQATRSLLEEFKTAQVRLREPLSGYPIDLAVHGPDDSKVRALATKLADGLRCSRKLIDVAADRASELQRQLYVDIDRLRAADLGLSLSDINAAIQTALGAYYVNDFDRFGRTWRVVVQLGDRSSEQVENLRQLNLRNKRGDMVPLGTVAAVRPAKAPAALDRLDGRPMVQITANPAAGVSPADARKLCEELAKEVRKELRLPAEYRLTWLGEVPAGR
jgi:multidrug efflux pump subunit AcrB